MKKETSAVWYKDGHEIKADEHLGFAEGVLKLEIAQVRDRRKKSVTLPQELNRIYDWKYCLLCLFCNALGTETFSLKSN